MVGVQHPNDRFSSWFLSSLFIIRVAFFLLFGFSYIGGPKIKKGKRVPLRDLDIIRKRLECLGSCEQGK